MKQIMVDIDIDQKQKTKNQYLIKWKVRLIIQASILYINYYYYNVWLADLVFTASVITRIVVHAIFIEEKLQVFVRQRVPGREETARADRCEIVIRLVGEVDDVLLSDVHVDPAHGAVAPCGEGEIHLVINGVVFAILSLEDFDGLHFVHDILVDGCTHRPTVQK